MLIATEVYDIIEVMEKRNEERGRFCRFCGKKLSRKRLIEKAKFCNDQCYGLSMRLPPRICEICEKKLNHLQTQKKQRFCSIKCQAVQKSIDLKNGRNKALTQYWQGRKRSLEVIRKFRESHKGKKQSPETIEKRIQKGSAHYNWKGGISRDPYGFDFNKELKELIRKRDNHKCQLCGAPQEEFTKKLPIHHIGYDKEDNDPKHLITLCISCNSKVNKDRKFWSEYFLKLLRERQIA